MLFEHGLNVSWGVVVMWVAGVLTLGCFAGAWRTDSHLLGLTGLGCSIIAASLSVIQDNAKTRRVVRATIREQQQQLQEVPVRLK